jgi:rod shape-determining protein MreC
MANGAWRIARTRGGAHLPLIIVAVLAVALILIGKAQPALFDRARAGVTDGMAPVLKATEAPLQGFNRWVGSLGDIFTIYDENLKLKEENARLVKWRSTAEVLNDRLRQYQTLLHAVPDPALSKVAARVIGRANHPFLQTIILDAGKNANIRPGQAVIDSRGMIGRIYLSGERTAWVIPLTDLNSRVPVVVEPGDARAIMAGNNSRLPVIEALSRGIELKAGAQVISSGDGDILPAGLQIGIVVPYGKEYRVALFADQSGAQDVEVLDYKRPVEKPPAAMPTDLPVTAAGLPPAPPQVVQPRPVPPPVQNPPPAAKPTAVKKFKLPISGGNNDETDEEIE